MSTRSSPVLRVVLAVALAGMVVLAAVLVPLAVRAFDDAAARRAVDLSQVVSFADLPTTHLSGDIPYPLRPPPGGPHAGEWLECGVYDRPVRDENVVHALEHGTVWITYLPGTPAADVEALEGLLPDEGILSPYPEQPAPVVVTVWGRQLALSGADDPRLPLFLARFGDGGTSPEPFASCRGGVVEYAGSVGTRV